MAFLALHNGRPSRPVKGATGTCLSPECRGEMIAKIGSGLIKAHWAHRHAGDCQLDNNEESGWHRTWRTLFQLNGCLSEVHFNGRKHRADAVTPDQRVVEFQTDWLRWDQIRSREDTYDRMAWVYRVTDTQTDLDLADATLDSLATFTWYTPRRSILAHVKPVYWHRSDEAIWSIKTIYRTTDVTEAGNVVWRGVAELVATDWADFAERISNGEAFCEPPNFHGFEALEARRALAAAMHAEPTSDIWLDMDVVDCPLARPRTESSFRPAVIRSADVGTLERIEHFRRTCPPCSVCHSPMVVGQHVAHYTCLEAAA